MNEFALPDPANLAPTNLAPTETEPPTPKSFGKILDRCFRLMRGNLRLFLSIAAIPSVGILLVFIPAIALWAITILPQIKEQAEAPDWGKMAAAGVLFVLGYMVLPCLMALYFSAASYAVTRVDLGFPVTLSEAYGVAWRRFGRHLWLIILCALYILVPLLAFGLIVGVGAIILSTEAGSGAAFLLIPVAVLAYIGFGVYSVWTMLRFSLAFAACVVEELPARAALRRSDELTSGAKGRIFLVMLAVYALTYVVTMACMLAFLAVGALGVSAALLAHVTEGSPAFFVLIGLAILGYLFVIIVSCIFSYAGITTALGIIYHDQRLRKEGLAAAQAGGIA